MRTWDSMRGGAHRGVRIPQAVVLLLLATACDRTDVAFTEYPCVLDFVPTGIALRGDVGGATPDPTERIARGPDGRFYTDTDAPGEIAVWETDGTFLNTIGRPGEGPGEMGGFLHFPVVDGQGILHVFDTGMRAWHRFAPDGEFISRAVLSRMPHAYNVAVIGTDSLVANAPYGSDHVFELIDASGGVLTEIATRPDLTVDVDPERALAYLGGSTFWAAPLNGGLPDGYVLERWTFRGELASSIHRDAPWFPVGGVGGESESGRPSVAFPIVLLFAGEGAHLLSFVILSFPDDPSASPDAEPSRSPDGGAVRYEVIDAETSEVLASRHVPLGGPGLGDLPFVHTFPGTRAGIRTSRDELGLATIEILEYTLEPHPNATQAQAQVCTIGA